MFNAARMTSASELICWSPNMGLFPWKFPEIPRRAAGGPPRAGLFPWKFPEMWNVRTLAYFQKNFRKFASSPKSCRAHCRAILSSNCRVSCRVVDAATGLKRRGRRGAVSLSPGCRAVELSRLRRAAVEVLSRPCLSSLSSSCRVAVE